MKNEIKVGDWVNYNYDFYENGTGILKNKTLLGQVLDTSEVGQANAHYITSVGHWHCDECTKIAPEEALRIGCEYWIFTGWMQPFKSTLIKTVNEGRTAILQGGIRKISSVYHTKEAALKIGNIKHKKMSVPIALPANKRDKSLLLAKLSKKPTK